jgi:hypothetical protein
MSLTFNKSTDTEHVVKLDSKLISATWTCGSAMAGGRAGFQIQTAFVGEGAPITVKGKSENGAKLGTMAGVVTGNRFGGLFIIPEDIELDDKVYFEFKLKKNDLNGESERIPAIPIVRIFNLHWSAEDACRGDIVTLTADTKGLRDHSDVIVSIFEYDEDRGAEKMIDLPGRVIDKHIEIMWEFGYFEDTEQIAGQPELNDYAGRYVYPEYYFTVTYESTIFGAERESGMLVFNDWQAITLVNEDGTPAANERYILHLANGEQREGSTDQDGFAREEHLPPGPTRIEFPDV